jgi:tRNA uridine 5-carbamoylmethylation protein Kti12
MINIPSRWKTYLVIVDGVDYVDQIAVDGYGTTQQEHEALVLDYKEATDLCFQINKNAGKIDKAVMIEAIEKDEEEEDDYWDREKTKEEALMEYADDNWREQE